MSDERGPPTPTNPAYLQGYVIWWLTEADCRLLGEPHRRSNWAGDDREEGARVFGRPGTLDLEATGWPDYLQRQYRSRYGRAGRGRLWVTPEIPVERIAIPDDHPLTPRIAQSGGIVLHARDLHLVSVLPGLVTTLTLQTLAGLAPAHTEDA